MKKSQKKLLIFEIVIMLVILLSSFVSSILSNYVKILMLIIISILFKQLFGFERDRNRYSKPVCIEIIIYMLIYFLSYYLFGILITFVKTQNYLNYSGLIDVIIPTILIIVIKEILRYMILRKSEGSKILIVNSCLFFIIFDLMSYFNNIDLSSSYSIFIFISIILLPIISENVFCTYLSYKSGIKPGILYLLIKKMYIFFVPIVPNPNEYLYSIIELLIPMISLLFIHKYFKNLSDETIPRDYNKKRIGTLIFPSILVIFLVYITSGYFYYHAIVIASGSMTPNIRKGDVVVIEKIKDKKNIEIGEVLAYKSNNIIVVHRIVKKIRVDGQVYYYTKGDANNLVDNYKIEENQIIGIVNIKIPYIGYPNIWLKEL